MKELSRVRYWLPGAILLLIAIGCFAAKAVSPEYVDADGILHEAFYLLPLGYLSLVAGIGALLGGWWLGKRHH